MTALPRPTGITTRSPWSDIEAGLWRVLEGRAEFVGLGLTVYRTYDGNILTPDPQTSKLPAADLPAVIGEFVAARPQRNQSGWEDVITWRLRGLFPAVGRASAEEFAAVATGILGAGRGGWQQDQPLAALVRTVNLGTITCEPLSGLLETGAFIWQTVVELSITTAPYRGG